MGAAVVPSMSFIHLKPKAGVEELGILVEFRQPRMILGLFSVFAGVGPGPGIGAARRVCIPTRRDCASILVIRQ